MNSFRGKHSLFWQTLWFLKNLATDWESNVIKALYGGEFQLCFFPVITVNHAHCWKISAVTSIWDCSSKRAQFVAVTNDPQCISGSTSLAHTSEETRSVSNMKANLDETSWMYIGCHTQGLVFLFYFNQIWNVLTDFIKNSKYISWNLVCGIPSDTCRQSDVMKLVLLYTQTCLKVYCLVFVFGITRILMRL